MEKRAYTVDLLRGLAIVGMVLSGQILWHAELPAWLFHAQVPPPSFRFDPSVPGITWVDLVFPFFLFSMGAAFPLALRRRPASQGGEDELDHLVQREGVGHAGLVDDDQARRSDAVGPRG